MSGGVPAGWVLVPVEPTEAMVKAAINYRPVAIDQRLRFAWADMLSAIPTPTPPIEGRDADVERVAIREYLIACADECDRQGSLYAQSGNVCAVPKLRAEAKAYRNAARMVDEQAHASYRSAVLQALGERP